jgi:hypothetical protein
MDEVADVAAGADEPSDDRAADAGGSASPPASKKTSRWRRVAGGLVSLALILLIFLGVIPQFASYQNAWTAIQTMSPGWWVAIGVAAILNQVSFVWPYQAVLPHLRFWHGFWRPRARRRSRKRCPPAERWASGLSGRRSASSARAPRGRRPPLAPELRPCCLRLGCRSASRA